MSKRNANVELFRVIAAVLVVLLHMLGASGILEDPENGAVYWIGWLLEICAFCAVNCFALISGYVMEGKKVKARSLMGLWLQVAFYSVLITVLFFAAVPETRSGMGLLSAVFPVLTKQWWYISSYFGVAVFLLCTAVDLLRLRLFRLVGVDRLCAWLDGRLTVFCRKFLKEE